MTAQRAQVGRERASPMRLIPGIRYIVTKGSDSADGTFKEGDKLFGHPDGAIVIQNIDAAIRAKGIGDSMEGVEFKLDKDWIDNKRRFLLEQLAELDAAIREEEESQWPNP